MHSVNSQFPNDAGNVALNFLVNGNRYLTINDDGSVTYIGQELQRVVATGTNSNGSISWAKYSDGIVHQWGYVVGDVVGVSLPYPYANLQYSISASPYYPNGTDGTPATIIYERTTSSFVVSGRLEGIGNIGVGCYWQTIGTAAS